MTIGDCASLGVRTPRDTLHIPLCFPQALGAWKWPQWGVTGHLLFGCSQKAGLRFGRGESPSPCPCGGPTSTMAHPTLGRWQQHPAPHWKMPKSMGRDCAAAVPGLIPCSKARQCLADFPCAPCPSPHTGRLNSSGDLPAGNDTQHASPADSAPDAHGSSRKF